MNRHIAEGVARLWPAFFLQAKVPAQAGSLCLHSGAKNGEAIAWAMCFSWRIAEVLRGQAELCGSTKGPYLLQVKEHSSGQSKSHG